LCFVPGRPSIDAKMLDVSAVSSLSLCDIRLKRILNGLQGKFIFIPIAIALPLVICVINIFSNINSK